MQFYIKQLIHKYSMNYENIYSALILNAQTRNEIVGYCEMHHIIPKCLGGSNDVKNLVRLTAREHYVAHLLLAKIHGGPLWHAVKMMGSIARLNSRMYETARQKHSKIVSLQNKKLKSKPKEIRRVICSNCQQPLEVLEFVHHTPKEHYYCNPRCRNTFVAKFRKSRKGIPNTANIGKTSWNKGLANPNGAINGQKGAKKQSETATGRKRKYFDDGSWTWDYPQK